MRAGHSMLLLMLCFGAAVLLQGCGGSPSIHHDASTATSSTTTQVITTTSTSSTTNVVDALNELYRRDDDGVFVRVMKSGYEQPWLGGGDHTSWAVFNKYAWDSEKKVLTMYGYGLLVGMIALPHVKETMARCMFPCDGATYNRAHNGCGCNADRNCNQPDKGDWCGANSLHNQGPGHPCAMHPNETARMLQVYKDVKAGKGPMWTTCHSSYIGDNTNAWTEVDIDTSKWNAVAHQSILAFSIPNECEANDTPVAKQCFSMFQKMWGNWKATYDEIPVVRVNRTNRVSPFSFFPTATLFNQEGRVVV